MGDDLIRLRSHRRFQSAAPDWQMAWATLRTKAGLSTVNFADRVQAITHREITVDHVERWDRGPTPPPADVFSAAMSIAGVDLMTSLGELAADREPARHPPVPTVGAWRDRIRGIVPARAARPFVAAVALFVILILVGLGAMTRFGLWPGQKSAPAGTVLFRDDFQSDQLGKPPARWRVGLGSWQVRADGGGRFLHQDDTDLKTSRTITVGSESWTSYRVQARVRPGSSGGNVAYSLNAHCQDVKDSRYSLILKNADVQGKHWYFGKVVSGHWSDLADSAPFNYLAGNWYTLELDVVGTKISAAIDGRQITSATDSSIPSGSVCLRTNYASDYGDVLVTAL